MSEQEETTAQLSWSELLRFIENEDIVANRVQQLLDIMFICYRKHPQESVDNNVVMQIRNNWSDDVYQLQLADENRLNEQRDLLARLQNDCETSQSRAFDCTCTRCHADSATFNRMMEAKVQITFLRAMLENAMEYAESLLN